MNPNANDDNDTDERRKSSSSSEGEYHVVQDFEFSLHSDVELKPVGVQFTYLLPVSAPSVRYCSSSAEQTPHVGKIKVSMTHRQQRRREFRLGKTIGRNIHEEKKLQKAASDNRYETVVELLEAGVDPRCHDDKQRTALHFAASRGNTHIVELLLDNGANPNSKDILGNTPMHLAAITGCIPVVTLLLMAGTDVKSVDKNGRTPLHLAQSRLKQLSRNTTRSSSEVKGELSEISEMLKTYLNISDLKVTSDQVDELCSRLEKSSTQEEVDAVSTLLDDFTNMSIRKEPS